MNRGTIKVLVTGAGSELAFGVIKACRRSSLRFGIMGCDCDPQALGLHWTDTGAVVPRADREPDAYVDAVEQLVRRHAISAIFPTADAELDTLPHYRDDFAQRLGCWIMVNSAEEMARFHDKWHAYEWYRDHDLPTPATARGDHPEELDRLIEDEGYPLIVKPRRGGGSRSLFTATDRASLDACLPLVPSPIVQALVGDPDQEFTAGTFRTVDDEVHVIVLRRQLKFGMTYRAQVVRDERLERTCVEIIRRTNLEGVNNIQFRKTGDDVRILEINPRFSGTTGIRAHFGFNEPEMVVRQFVLGEAPPAPRIVEGSVLRYMHESFTPAFPADYSTVEV